MQAGPGFLTRICYVFGTVARPPDHRTTIQTRLIDSRTFAGRSDGVVGYCLYFSPCVLIQIRDACGGLTHPSQFEHPIPFLVFPDPGQPPNRGATDQKRKGESNEEGVRHCGCIGRCHFSGPCAWSGRRFWWWCIQLLAGPLVPVKQWPCDGYYRRVWLLSRSSDADQPTSFRLSGSLGIRSRSCKALRQ
jgi:hypothetical protein